MSAPTLNLIAFEITRRCPLRCKHCRGDSRNEDYTGELTLGEIRAVLDNTAEFADPIIIVTGGEPLSRPDVFDITAYSSARGFRTVLATCGHLLDDSTVGRLLDTGVSRISVSLDGASADIHDRFRGVEGAFDAALKGLEAARRHGLEFQINSTLTSFNVTHIEALHDLALSIGAAGFHPFLLVPMGRGADIAGSALSPDEYEGALVRIAALALRSPIEIKPTCSPHYARIIRRIKPDEKPVHGSSEPCNSPESRPGTTLPRGCIGGKHFVFISHTGMVQICGFLDIPAGDLRETGWNLRSIWESSDFLRRIRAVDEYAGKCGACEFRNVCGGCRARAYYENGDYLGEEPKCTYIPARLKTEKSADAR